jgi:hypothetical protein
LNVPKTSWNDWHYVVSYAVSTVTVCAHASSIAVIRVFMSLMAFPAWDFIVVTLPLTLETFYSTSFTVLFRAWVCYMFPFSDSATLKFFEASVRVAVFMSLYPPMSAFIWAYISEQPTTICSWKWRFVVLALVNYSCMNFMRCAMFSSVWPSWAYRHARSSLRWTVVFCCIVNCMFSMCMGAGIESIRAVRSSCGVAACMVVGP